MSGFKYIKRTGSPGAYKYFYRMPDGTLQEGDKAKGQQEHAKRLAAGHIAGHHTMSIGEMASHAGFTTGHEEGSEEHKKNKQRMNSVLQKMKMLQRQGKSPHDFEEHHMKEATHTDVHHPAYDSHLQAAEAGGRVAERRAERTSPGVRAAQERTAGEAAGQPPARSQRRRATTGRAAGDIPETDEEPRRRRTPRAAPVPLPTPVSGAAAAVTEPTPAPRPRPQLTVPGDRDAERRGAPTAAQSAEEAKKEKQKRALEALRGHGITFDEESPAAAQASVERVRAALAAHPASSVAPHARELATADPDFRASETPVRRMEEAASRGANPYLASAKGIFEKIKSSIDPGRKSTTEHLLQAMSSGKTDSEMKSAYQSLSGSELTSAQWNKVKDSLEKVTGFTAEEITSNKPLDLEVERMKRGYAAKQMERLKPFLKASFTSANPSAPPPMPTFGDIKSWAEHGGAKPSWAGTTRLAMPQEVHEAAVKGPDGKPLYPPAWMPVHLMPVWNYVAKKGGPSSYQAVAPQFSSEGSPDVGHEANFREGMIIASLRKYVQKRGAGKMTDIPKSKLAEAGLTHADIYRGEMDIKELIKRKIIDPVALMPFIKEEMKGMKKSFTLVVDQDLPGIIFQKSHTVPLTPGDIAKARIIKIRGLIYEKTRSRMS